MVSRLCRVPRPTHLLIAVLMFWAVQGLLLSYLRCTEPSSSSGPRLDLPSRSAWQPWPPAENASEPASAGPNDQNSPVMLSSIVRHRSRSWKPAGGKKRLFFVISTGHTGTMFLVRALRCGLNVTANHEQAPAIVQFPSILRRGLKATYAKRQAEKLQAFVEWVDKTGDFPYAEISHMMTKSWADVALDWLLRDERYEINFIILRRHLIYVLRSMLLVDVWRPDSMLMYNGASNGAMVRQSSQSRLGYLQTL